MKMRPNFQYLLIVTDMKQSEKQVEFIQSKILNNGKLKCYKYLRLLALIVSILKTS